MALDFPTSPSLNDTYTLGSRTWRWNGVGWVLTGTTSVRSVAAGATSGTLTPNADTTDQFVAEGLTGAVTLDAVSGTPTDGQKLMIRLKDDGTTRSLTWTSSTGGYRAIGVPLPTATVPSKTTYIGCVYNSSASLWDAIGVITEV